MGDRQDDPFPILSRITSARKEGANNRVEFHFRLTLAISGGMTTCKTVVENGGGLQSVISRGKVIYEKPKRRNTASGTQKSPTRSSDRTRMELTSTATLNAISA